MYRNQPSTAHQVTQAIARLERLTPKTLAQARFKIRTLRVLRNRLFMLEQDHIAQARREIALAEQSQVLYG